MRQGLTTQSWLDWNLLHRLGWLWTHQDPPASTSWVLGLWVCPAIQPFNSPSSEQTFELDHSIRMCFCMEVIDPSAHTVLHTPKKWPPWLWGIQKQFSPRNFCPIPYHILLCVLPLWWTVSNIFWTDIKTGRKQTQLGLWSPEVLPLYSFSFPTI